MRFIDLFAGLGGFHLALSKLGHKCVFASEIDEPLRALYKKNFGKEPKGDIKAIIKYNKQSIPKHDILCAGFPCQPFSKAGKQAGMEDESRGTLFDDIYKILEFRKPKYFILENVPFIKKHDNSATWKYIHSKLAKLGYDVDSREFSPHQFGIPQHRERTFIVGSLHGLKHFFWPAKEFASAIDASTFLDAPCAGMRKVHDDEIGVLNLWQKFLNTVPRNEKIPGFPIWAMEFGATYPYEKGCPHRMSKTELGKYKGNFGVSLKGLKKKEQMARLPSYARTTRKFPNWKVNWIRKNREFYRRYRHLLEDFALKLSQYESQSWQKLEWNVQDSERNIFNYILQFRASGIRVKHTDCFPSLVCANTQIPIVGWQRRYITKAEGARLQALEGLKHLPENDNAAFKALGNAVNAKIVELIAESLIKVRKKKNIVQRVENALKVA